MVENRGIQIKDKIFSKDDLKRIWSLLTEQPMPPERSYSSPLKIQITCADGTSYESTDDELLRDDNIIDLKRVETIDFEYHNYDSNKSARISLQRGDSSYGTRFSISGDDREWVAGVFSKFQEILDAVKPQQHWLPTHKNKVLYLGTFIFGFSFFEIGRLVLGDHNSLIGWFIKTSFSNVLLVGYGVFFLGFLCSVALVTWASMLWPNIEFAFGPEHLQIEQVKRTRVWILLSVFIIPLIISLGVAFI